MITEFADVHSCDQARPSDATWNRPWWKRSRRDAVLATTASVLGPHVDVSFQPGRLKLEFSRDILTNAVHRLATARAHLFFIIQIMVVDDLSQFLPIDLTLLATTMALDFGFGFLLRCGFF